MIDHPADKARTVKAGGRTGAAPNIGISKILLSLVNHGGKLRVAQGFRRDLIGHTVHNRERVCREEIVPVAIGGVIQVVRLLLFRSHAITQDEIQIVVGDRHTQATDRHSLCDLDGVAAVAVSKVRFPCLMTVSTGSRVIVIVDIELHTVSRKVTGILNHVLCSVHDDMRSHRHEGIVGINGNGMVGGRINPTGCRAA